VTADGFLTFHLISSYKILGVPNRPVLVKSMAVAVVIDFCSLVN